MTKEIFDEFGDDPIALYKSWLADAEKEEINDPDAVCLATATKDGRPSARMVLVKDISSDGIKFHSNAQSRKGQELLDNPFAALCIHWKSLRKQIRIEGRVEVVSEAESDAYFKTRPHGRQVGAWASKQSRPYDTRDVLKSEVQKYKDKFEGDDNIPRPAYWKGFRIVPENLEFWIGNRDRLHTRFIYTQKDDGAWDVSWLYP